MYDSASLRILLLDELAAFLNKSPAEIDDDRTFDEYGLDSIDGVLITGSIGERLGIDLPPELLMQYRKVGEAFAAIAKLAGVSCDAIDIPLPRETVFLFAGGAGRDGRLAALAQHCTDRIDGEFVSWGNWHQWIAEGGKLSMIIDSCCTRIDEQYAKGPVRLAGYSQGGQLAFAVATELIRRGRDVTLLVMIDSPVQERGKQISLTSYLKQNRRSFYTIALRRAGQRIAAIRRRAPGADLGEDKLSKLSEMMRLLPRLAPLFYTHVAAELSQRDLVIFDNYMQMQYFDLLWETWVAKSRRALPPQTHAWLLRSEDKGMNDLGWSEFCESLNIRRVKGTHLSMFDDENIGNLALAFVDVVTATERSNVIAEAESMLAASIIPQ